jgi:hypothetical protein
MSPFTPLCTAAVVALFAGSARADGPTLSAVRVYPPDVNLNTVRDRQSLDLEVGRDLLVGEDGELDVVGHKDAPQRTSDIEGGEHEHGRALVRQVEAVAVDGEDMAVLVKSAGGELEVGLNKLLHHPPARVAVPAGAEDASRTPVAGEEHAFHAAIAGDAEALHRAAGGKLRLLTARIRL